MGYLEGFGVTFRKLFKGTRDRPHRHRAVREGLRAEARRSPSASTAATSSTATRTAWRSASAASCAPACARPAASTCAAPTTRPTTRCRPGERYGFVYEINYLRCIHCDLCVEACPTEAITETKLFEFSFTNRQDAIYTKAELLVDDDGLPAAAAVGGLDATSTRSPRSLGVGAGHRARRATPTTRARSAWSGELGFGVKPPEQGQTAPSPSAEPDDDGRRRPRRAPLMELVVFLVAGGVVHRRRARRGAQQQPGARRALPGRHAVRHRRAVRRPGGPLPRRRAGDRLRRRHRRAVPVRDHAARRRPGRGPRRSSRSARPAHRRGRRRPRRARPVRSLAFWLHRAARPPAPGRALGDANRIDRRRRPTSTSSASRSSPTYLFAFEITSRAARHRRRRRRRARPHGQAGRPGRRPDSVADDRPSRRRPSRRADDEVDA